MNSARSWPRAGLADRVEIAAADPPHDWVPPSSAVGAGRGADRLVGAVAAAMRAILGAEPRPGVLLGVTDSCWLTEAGIPTLPAFGCGSLAWRTGPTSGSRPATSAPPST